MARILGFFGLAGGFLMISPGLRQSVADGAAAVAGFAASYSPYSYCAGVFLAFGVVTITLMTGQQKAR